MNTRGFSRHPLSIALIACAAFALLSACQPADASTPPPAEPTVVVLPTQPAAQPTQPPVEATQPLAEASGDISLDLSGIAQDQTVETIEAVSADSGVPWWEVAPEHRRVTLQGYPVTGNRKEPQVFVYPVADLAESSEMAGQMVADLQALLESRQPAEHMPFLPALNEVQAMHAQVQYLDFKNGAGVGFLTQFGQGIVPVNNLDLFYTFQGLTSDGQFYVAAVLPVTHPDLPATNQAEAYPADHVASLAETVIWLDQQPGSSFTPDLAALDALIQSIEVK